MNPVINWIKGHRLIVTGGVALVILFTLVPWYNGVRNEGIDREATLTAQYPDNQQVYGTCLTNIHNSFGIAVGASDKVDQILSNAVKGRYGGGTGVGATPFDNKAFVSALAEAYPQTGGVTDLFARTQETAVSCRTGYSQLQSKLLDMLQRYDAYRKKGLVRHMLVKMAGFPSSDLRAGIGSDIVTGQAALNRMYSVVQTRESREAYTTGTEATINFSTQPR